MKRILILALLIQGICNASVFGMVQEITLNEMYSIMPIDDTTQGNGVGRPDPNQFHAFIDGNQLLIEANTKAPLYIEVINKRPGEVVASREFVNATEILIQRSGVYIIQIYSGNTVMTGEFRIE